MRTVEKFLADSDSPVFGVVTAKAAQAAALRYRLPELGYVMREVRGAKMPTVEAVFDEFAAAFQFPDYFGENKDAFDECMRDLEEFVGVAKGYVVVVRDAAQLLRDEPAELAWFADAMAFYASEWSNRKDPVVFRVVLQDRTGSVPFDAERLTLDA
jgi:hypothetical protein